MKRVFALMLACLLASGFYACNNGGSGTNYNDLLIGTFILNSVSVDSNTHGFYQTELIFDGVGGGTWENAQSADSGTLTYSIANDGTATVNVNNGANSFTLTGVQASPDGSVFAFADADESDDNLEIAIGIKQSSGLSNATLNGDYILVEIGSGNLVDHYSSRLLMTFDGGGSAGWEYLDDSSGITGMNGTTTYTVANSGSITIGSQFDGQVSSDGRFFNYYYYNDATGQITYGIGIKQSSGLSNATLNGNYKMFMLGYSGGTTHWTSRMLLTADGIDSATAQILEDSGGDTGSDPVTYSVAGNGTLGIDGAEGGQIDSSGNVFNYVETDSGGDGLTIVIGIRETD